MLTTATVDRTILGAAAVHADTCSLTLSALSPRHNLWDAIPRDIDTLRHQPDSAVREYCRRLVDEAEYFSKQIRTLIHERRLVMVEPIKQEVIGQKGRTNGLALRAEKRFPFAPSDLVRKCLGFQMAVHDHALQAQQPIIEKKLLDALMKRINTFWSEQQARLGYHVEVSYADKILFATAAANAIMLENSEEDGHVVLVSRDFNHVFRMYQSREDIVKPVCKKHKLLYPRNFMFRPSFQQSGNNKN